MSQANRGKELRERRLSAILAADVVGYSRLMGDDEEGTLAALMAHRNAVVDPAIAPTIAVGSSRPLAMACWSNSPALATPTYDSSPMVLLQIR
jgi:hypothetical protein